MRTPSVLLLLLALPGLAGCSGEEFSQEEKRIIGSLRLSQLAPLPPDPSNAVADDPAAKLRELLA